MQELRKIAVRDDGTFDLPEGWTVIRMDRETISAVVEKRIASTKHEGGIETVKVREVKNVWCVWAYGPGRHPADPAPIEAQA